MILAEDEVAIGPDHDGIMVLDPELRPGSGNRLNLAAPFSFHFDPPDFDRFPALRLAYQAVRAGGFGGEEGFHFEVLGVA